MGPSGTGGQVRLGDFFRGETARVFGGVEYRTPVEGLTLKVEYDAHNYAADVLPAPARSPFNYGLVFRPYPYFEVAFGNERGNTTMLRFGVKANLRGRGVGKVDPPPPPITPRPTLQALVGTSIVPAPQEPVASGAPNARLPIENGTPTAGLPSDGLLDALAELGLTVEFFELAGAEAVVLVSRALTGPQSLERAAQIVLDRLPGDVLTATLVVVAGIHELDRARVSRTTPAALDPADALYEAFAWLGLEVIEVEFTGDAVRVTVDRASPIGPTDLTVARRAVAAAFPSAASVTVVGRAADGMAARDLFLGTPRLTSAGTALQEQIAVPETAAYTAEEREAVVARMNEQLRVHGVVLETLELGDRSAVASLTNLNFLYFSRNFGEAARVVANNLPAPIEEITIAFLNAGMETLRITFLRGDLEQTAALFVSVEEFWMRAAVGPGEPWQPGDEVRWRYPRLDLAISPQLRQHIGGPSRVYLYQAWLSLTASIDVARGLNVFGEVGKNLYHNFDRIRLVSDSRLPHVRSEIKNYLQQGADNLVRLQATYLFKPAHDLYGRLSAGILEEMYGGVSGEILYRPFDSRLALGTELSWVKQRAFDQRLMFRDYTVVTGHVSLYYEAPYKNVLLWAHAGRCLAADRGVTFDISRRFESGVRVGAWTTFTNVTAAQFGDGSFDKGFFITIPLELFLTRSSSSTGAFAFRPLTRDGGQRLVLSNRLYDMTADASFGGVMRSWPYLLQ